MANRAAAKTSKQRIIRCQNATKVLQLRLQGLSHRAIGERLGFSDVRSLAICKGELDRLNSIRNETCEQVQRLEVERLDALWQVAYAKALKGDLKALGKCLDIQNRRARLLGLDVADRQPEKGNATVILNVNEVVLEATHNGQSPVPIETDPAPSGPAALPEV